MKMRGEVNHRVALRSVEQADQSLEREILIQIAVAGKYARRLCAWPRSRIANDACQLAHYTGQGELAQVNAVRGDDSSRFGFARIGLVFSALLVVGACLTGLYQFEQQRRIEELADMDAAVLTDDLPISAYTDHGFNAFLKQNP